MTQKEYNKAIDEYSDNIFRFALKHLRNEMSAKDIVQETFTKVWIKHEEVDYAKVKSYLFTTAYHAIVDWVKKEKRSGDILQAEERSTTQDMSFEIHAFVVVRSDTPAQTRSCEAPDVAGMRAGAIELVDTPIVECIWIER